MLMHSLCRGKFFAVFTISCTTPRRCNILYLFKQFHRICRWNPESEVGEIFWTLIDLQHLLQCIFCLRTYFPLFIKSVDKLLKHHNFRTMKVLDISKQPIYSQFQILSICLLSGYNSKKATWYIVKCKTTLI